MEFMGYGRAKKISEILVEQLADLISSLYAETGSQGIQSITLEKKLYDRLYKEIFTIGMKSDSRGLELQLPMGAIKLEKEE